jgi:glucose/mannose transport system permease protein
MAQSTGRPFSWRHLWLRAVPWLALLPLAAVVLGGYLGTMLWTLRISLSSSRTFPTYDYVGLAQYLRLFDNERWLLSLQNIAVYGLLFVALSILLGFLLAAFIDQKVRAESALRTVYLYPYAMSFIATGLVWQWLLNPGVGIEHAMRDFGFADFRFDWIADQDMVIYTVVLATVWQSAGLVMAIILAGLRGIDSEIWKAARLDGIPVWRVYVSIVVPMLAPTLATVFVLLFTAVVKLFDSVVAMTQGGPGTASEVPAKFVMDHLFGRANIALASAASISMLVTVLALAAPVLYLRARRRGRGAAA